MSIGHTRREPDATRWEVVQAAYAEIHRKGYQGASLNDVLARTGLTKGALYHHFPSKQALGYAVLDEVIAAEMRAHWLTPLHEADDPLAELANIIRRAATSLQQEDLLLGCPLNNLAQEMSALDEGFRTRINTLYDEWRQALVDVLRRGQHTGQVKPSVDIEGAAAFIVAGVEGCIGMAKNAQSRELLMRCGSGLLLFLDGLHPLDKQQE